MLSFNNYWVDSHGPKSLQYFFLCRSVKLSLLTYWTHLRYHLPCNQSAIDTLVHATAHLPHTVYQIVVTTVTIQRVALNILPNPIFCCFFFHIHSLPNLYKILYSFTMLYFTLHQMVYYARCFYHPLVSLCINYFQTNVTNQFICYKTFVF